MGFVDEDEHPLFMGIAGHFLQISGNAVIRRVSEQDGLSLRAGGNSGLQAFQVGSQRNCSFSAKRLSMYTGMAPLSMRPPMTDRWASRGMMI